jgi:hypothetical protein
MAAKTYRTFAQIDKELEIYKVEKELAYQKFLREFDETKESLMPKNIIGDTPRKVFSAISGPLKSAALTLLLKKLF